MRRLYNLTFRLFASLKLTLVILVGLSIALFTGMFWDQTQTLQAHLETIKNPVARKIFLFLEFNDVYHSWWFGILVLLLALNLIACSIARLPKLWIDARNPHRKLDDFTWRRANEKSEGHLTNQEAPIFSKHEQSWQESDTRYVFFQKHTYARCGVYIIHTALLFMMFGSIVATQAGVDGMMLIPEGGFEHIVQAKGPGGLMYSHDLGFAVSCTDFRLKTYTDGSPMEYESDLAIYDKNNLDTPIVTKTIRVNDPLEYQGYTFYQASYQTLEGEKLVNLKVGPHGGPLISYQTKLGTPLTLPSSSRGEGELRVTEIYEDYAGLGSAVQIQQGKSQFVVFRKYPEFDSEVRRGEWDVIFQGFDEPYATGISVGKVPGLWAVFFGFIIMFIGLAMAFGMNQRRYYAKLSPNPEGGFDLKLAGICNRYPQAFKKEFAQIVGQHLSL